MSRKISRKISEIYSQYEIPKNLQRHMLRVTSVGEYICNHWQEKINSQLVIEALLLHDMGNVLKFDLEKDGLSLFDEDEQEMEKWQRVQASMKLKYGETVHGVTMTISKEVGANDRVISLLENMGSSNFKSTFASESWELKITSYADFRVGPLGFMSVEDRFDDFIDRYKKRDDSWEDEVLNKEKKQACVEVEKQLQEHCEGDLKNLPENELENRALSLRGWEFV